MHLPRSLRAPLVLVSAALAALSTTAASSVRNGVADAVPSAWHAPTALTENGPVRGLVTTDVSEFLGLPYAAPPTGNLRWRAPKPAADWTGVRDATQFGPSCPQLPSPFMPSGPVNEDCLYLNVYTPTPNEWHRGPPHPVLVWIHGGGLTEGAGRSYNPTALAADGTVVVTINYRLGPLGFLAHPALASWPGGPAGNYGLMDQQAALRWVQRNIRSFGGDPGNVTIAGESAGGLSVLAHLVSPGSRGLFEKAIVESGAFALAQQSLSSAETFGEGVAAAAGCPDQTAACLRNLPVGTLLSSFPSFAIPGVVDGKVLTQSIGTALATGRFAHVPVLNGVNHDEELLFVILTTPVSGGTFVQLTAAVTDANYQQTIESTLGVSAARAAAIAVEYPTSAYGGSAPIAFSVVMSDSNFACPALQVDRWTSARASTFTYEFDDDAASPRFPVATHGSELPLLFGLPDAPNQTPLTPDEQALSATMQAAWASFAANGDPSTPALPWPSFNRAENGLSLRTPQPVVDSQFAARHHCSFWDEG